MRIVIAPDSYKGGPNAAEVAHAIAEGWLRQRGGDDVVELPLADGGEGTLQAMAAAVPGAERHEVRGVTGPDDRPVDSWYLLLPDGTAVVELAATSGLPMMAQPDPLGAHTAGLGEVIRAAIDTGARRLVVAAGGSASTDGGMGAFTALGLGLFDSEGDALPPGGGALRALASLDRTGLVAAPKDGVEVLTDVDSPLTGPNGAAAIFGPQKGATAGQIAELDAALRHLAKLLGGAPYEPGAGAAGGTAYGFATLWGAALRSGSAAIAAHVGLERAVVTADLVITGEGRLDATSFAGKVVGTVTATARRQETATAVIAGGVDPAAACSAEGLNVVSLTNLAGSVESSLAEPLRFLRLAGERLARKQSVG